MPDQDSTNRTQSQDSQPSADANAVSKRLEEEADEMADAASKTEQRYDEDHGIFTK